MGDRATRRSTPAVVLWGGFGVLAWAILSVFVGGGSADAAEQSDDPLALITSVIGDTVSSVVAPLVPVVNAVATPVEPILAPVEQVLAPVEQVLAPVIAPVQQIAEPVLELVTELPVVGDVVNVVVPPVVNIITPIIPVVRATPGGPSVPTTPGDPSVPAVPAGPSSPVAPSTPGDDDHETVPAGSHLATAAAPVVMVGAPAPESSSDAAAIRDIVGPMSDALDTATEASAADAPALRGTPDDTPTSAPIGDPAAPTSSAGSGGSAAPAATARISDDGSIPRLCWTRDSGASDDTLPSSPVPDSDVSPD